MQMIRHDDLVGVRYDIRSHGDDFEIYDVAKDPAQRKNLAAGMKDLQQRMKDRVLQIRRPDASVPRAYMDSLAIPASPPGAATVPGLEARVIPSGVPWPVHPGGVGDATPRIVASPDKLEKPAGPRHGGVFHGWIDVPAEGAYRFSLPAGCRAILKLHDATVLDTDRGAGGGDVRLAAGKHPLTLSVVVEADSPVPALAWAVDGGTAGPVPETNFSRIAR